MSNSSLISTTVWCAEGNYTHGRQGASITHCTIHHCAGVLTAEQCGRIFQQAGRGASANYGIGYDGKIGLYVDESNAAWADGNWESNKTTVSIEFSNSSVGGDYPVSDATLQSGIKLIADIFKRNGIKKAIKGETIKWHSLVGNSYCPGDYLRSKIDYICDEVNKLLGDKPTPKPSKKMYKVQVGAFKEKANADKLAKQIENKGIDTYIVEANGYYKVQCGAFENVDNAKNIAKTLNNMGYQTYIEGLEETKTHQGTKYRVNSEYPNVRTGASLNSSVIRLAKKGEIIYVVGIVNGFYKLEDGTYLKVGFADKV